MPTGVIATLEKQSSDPAAGVEISFTADEDLIVHSLAFTLLTDATVANRFVSLVADDGAASGADIFFRSEVSSALAASLQARYSAFSGSQKSGSAYWTPLFTWPAGGLRLRKNDRLRTITEALQAGDNFSAVVFQVEHY